MLSYAKLWILMNEKGKKRIDLVEDGIIARGTLTKLGKNENVTTDVINKICDYLDCQPGDIMERITKEQIEETEKVMNEKLNEMFEMISVISGKSKNEILKEASIQTTEIIEKMINENTNKTDIKKDPTK